MASLPKRLIRVTWKAAVGWPEPENRHETARNFTKPIDAGRQLAIIEGMPSHLELVSVHESNDLEWREIDPATLPRPTEEDDAADTE